MKNVVLVFAVLVGVGLRPAHAGMLTEFASKDSYFSASNASAVEGKSTNLTVGGPADIYSAVAFAQSNPAGTTVTDFNIVFDIEETITTGITTSLNIWALGGSWDETSTRNSISGFSHIAEGSVTLTTGLLSNGDDSITFSGANLTALYNSGAVANGIFWQDNDLASLFPGGATAFSNNTSFGEVGTVTVVSNAPEPTTCMLIVIAVSFFVFRRCNLGITDRRNSTGAQRD